MYHHLLVPLDDSPLAVDSVSRAVEFARTLGARVTFFHAQSDYGASSIGALEATRSFGSSSPASLTSRPTSSSAAPFNPHTKP